MSTQWTPGQHGTNRAAAKTAVDGAVEEPAVSSTMLEVALGQPSPKIQPISSSDSSTDEEFVDAADVGAIKSPVKTHDSKAGADGRGGAPVVDYTPGRKPSWQFKQLFDKEGEEEEVVSSGIFPSVQASTSPTTESHNNNNNNNINNNTSRSSPAPLRPQPLSSPVLLAYSSRRESQTGKKTPTSGSPSATAMPPKPGSKNGGTATAETGPLRGTASPSGAFDSGRAPTSTTPVGPRASHAIHPIKVATVASRDAWFSSPSGRPSGSGEIAAELAALAATRGASSRLLGDATRASKDLQLAGEGCVRSGRSKTADSYVNSVAGRIAGRGTKKTEEVVAKPPPPYLGVLGTAAAVPKQRNEAGLPPPFDAAAVGAPPPLQPPQTSQSSPSAERSISLNAATTLGVSAPDLAGGDESTPKAAEASSAAADVTAAPAPVEVEVVTPAPTAAAAAVATAAQATPTAAAAATTADRSASLTETDGGKKKPPQKLPSFGKALSAGMPTDLLSRWRSSKKVKSPPADNAGETTPASADAAAGAGGRGRTARTPFRRRGSSKQRRHSLPPRGSPADGAQSPAVQLPGGGGAGGSSKSSFLGDGVAAAASAPILAPPPRAPGRARSRAPGAVAPAPRSVLPVVTATPTATTAPGFPVAAAGTTADDSLQGQERNAGEGPAADEEEQRSAEEEHREEDEPGQEPVAVIGQTMSLKGLLECGRSVKMEGSFSGDIVSTGDVIVAPTGKIAGDLKGLKFLLVEGEVVGDVVCDKVMVVGSGKVFGDITSVSIKIGPQATMRGRLNVVKDLDDLLQAAAAVDDKVEEADEKVEEDSGNDAKVALDLTKGEGTVEGAAEVAPADAATDADVDANDDDAGAATADAPAAPADADADADADTGAPADADADAPADASAPADAPADATAVAVDANELAAETFTDSDGESEVSSEAQQ